MTPGSAAALAMLAALAGCAATHGRFEPGLSEPVEDSVAIAVLGGAGAQGPAGHDTAKAVAEVLASARTADRDGVVLLVGDWAPHRHPTRRARGTRPPTPVVDGAVSASPRVGTRFALRGAAERRHASAAVEPTAVALVRIRETGRGETLSQCQGRTCRIESGAEPGLVDLVLLDLEPWRVPTPDADAAMGRITSLLDAVAASNGDTPRILVLSSPVEGAFEVGLGAQAGTAASFHMLPEVLQRHLAAGVFVGVVAGGERSLHVTPDLTRAVQRSDRVWLRAPVWQVVSGNATAPRNRRVARRSIWRGGIAHTAEVSTFRPGFAVVRVGGSDQLTIDLIARRRGRWESARTTLPLRPAAHAPATDAGHLSPCKACTDKPAPER